LVGTALVGHQDPTEPLADLIRAGRFPLTRAES
jgi:hypothetical protein